MTAVSTFTQVPFKDSSWGNSSTSVKGQKRRRRHRRKTLWSTPSDELSFTSRSKGSLSSSSSATKRSRSSRRTVSTDPSIASLHDSCSTSLGSEARTQNSACIRRTPRTKVPSDASPPARTAASSYDTFYQPGVAARFGDTDADIETERDLLFKSLGTKINKLREMNNTLTNAANLNRSDAYSFFGKYIDDTRAPLHSLFYWRRRMRDDQETKTSFMFASSENRYQGLLTLDQLREELLEADNVISDNRRSYNRLKEPSWRETSV